MKDDDYSEYTKYYDFSSSIEEYKTKFGHDEKDTTDKNYGVVEIVDEDDEEEEDKDKKEDDEWADEDDEDYDDAEEDGKEEGKKNEKERKFKV